MRAPILLLTCSLVSLPAAADLYKVGAVSDPACTHDSLQGALLSAFFNAGPDEIRLARNIGYVDERVQLINWSTAEALTIAGGYDNCADTTASSRTPVDGTADHPVIEMTGTNGGLLTLRRIAVEGSGRRGILVTGNNQVTLSASFVRSNADGGVRVSGDAKLVVDVDSRIWNNTTGGGGGGIFCEGTARVDLSGAVGGIGTPNHAAVVGGGIYAAGDCETVLFDGSAVAYNQSRDGAGIAAVGDSLVLALGAAQGVVIEQNVATDRGGGVFGSESSEVHLFNTRVRNNQAAHAGGGLFATGDFAQLSMLRRSGACNPSGPATNRCSTLEGNALSDGREGAAAMVDAGASLYLYQTQIEGNSAALDSNSALEAQAIGSYLSLESVGFLGNTVGILVRLDNAAALVEFVSATGNGSAGNPNAIPLYLLGNSGATLRSSIFWPNGPISVAAGSSISEARCLIVSTTAGLPPWATVVSTTNPLFIAPASDLHIRPDSPAVDFCDGAPSPYPVMRDVDYEQRAADQPANPDGSPGVPGGRVDIGLDEVDGWLMVAGFETGDLYEWELWWP
jgi:predicted outer membrane repeat protein